MDLYRHKIFTTHLEPKAYQVPPKPPGTKAVEALQPRLDKAELQEYPKEVGVILKGDNLWFCHKIFLGEGRSQLEINLQTEAEGNENTRFLINFSIIPTEHTRALVNQDGHMKVTVYSHFLNLTDQMIPVKQVCLALLLFIVSLFLGISSSLHV